MYRPRFEELWSGLPALTVLATLPGWGRTAWMTQAAQYVATLSATSEIEWITQPPELRARLARVREVPAALTLFVDDVFRGVDDPLWSELCDALVDVPTLRAVVSSIDVPPHLPGPQMRVLSEAELGFDDEELRRLFLHAPAGTPVDLIRGAARSAKGCPGLLKPFVTRLNRRSRHGLDVAPEFSPEIALVQRYCSPAGIAALAGTELGDALDRLTSFRRIDETTVRLVLPGGGVRRAQTLFARLAAIPGLVDDENDLTGQEELVWSDSAWQTLVQARSAPENEARGEFAARVLGARDDILGPLFSLLMLGQFEAAETLVLSEYRRFLLYLDANTVDLLRDLDEAVFVGRPGLAILAAEFGTRKDGRNPRSIRLNQNALIDLRVVVPVSAIDRLALNCLMSFAAVGCGDRAAATRSVTAVAELLGNLEIPTTSPVRYTLYFAYWPAIQLDRHREALDIATVMVEMLDPSDPIRAIEQVAVTTQRDLLGFRSVGRHGALASPELASHAASLLHIETGDDDDALEPIMAMLPLLSGSISRSAIDALMLVVRAIAGDTTMRASDIEHVVTRSRDSWKDGTPSEFIASAAVLAYLALGEDAAAQNLRDTIAENGTAFCLLADALVELTSSGSSSSAERLASSESPRLAAIGHVLTVCALVRAQRIDLAQRGLTRTWRVIAAPRLFRFAMRLMPADALSTILEGADGLDSELADAVRDCANDRRVFRAEHARLSSTEREVLRLLRSGLSNKEITESRFVSMNTLRTQLRSIYRKLAVTTRDAAVAEAERRGQL